MRLFFIFIALLSFNSAFADINCDVFLTELSGSKKYQAAAGKPLSIVLPEAEGPVSAIFLGRNLRLNGETKKFSFFVPSENKIHILRADELQITKDGEVVPEDKINPIVAGINQEDGTCAAYSIFNCMRQMHYMGNAGNGNLETWMANEEGRHRLLTRALYDYYIDDNHRDGIADISKKFGFKDWEVPNGSVAELKKNIRKYNWPILLRFDIGADMRISDYEMYDHRDDETYSKKLWLPRRSGERSRGGHMILVLDSFEVDGQEYLLIHDPNWTTPRLWKMNELDHLHSADIRAWVVWEETE